MNAAGMHDESSSNTWKWIVLLLSVLYIAGSLYFLFDLRTRVTALSSDQEASKQQLADLSKRLQSSDAKAEAQSEALARKIGLTKKELVSRAAQLQNDQKEAEAQIGRASC